MHCFVKLITNIMCSAQNEYFRISEISAPVPLTLADDFTKYFPDVDLSLSAQSG